MIDKINLTGKLRKNTTTIKSFVCKTSLFYFQGKNIYCQVSYFYAAFTEYSFIRRNVGRNASYVALKSFLLFQFMAVHRGDKSVFTSQWIQLAYTANSYLILIQLIAIKFDNVIIIIILEQYATIMRKCAIISPDEGGE